MSSKLPLRSARVGLATLLLIGLAGCGGGGGGANPRTPTPAPVTPPPPGLVIQPTRLSDAVVGKPYSATVIALNAIGAVTWTKESGFPSWANLNAQTGEITGTPPNSGFITVTVKATDSAVPPRTAVGSPGVQIAEQIRFDVFGAPLPAATTSVPFNHIVGISGGLQSGNGYVAEIVSGGLPAGLNIEGQFGGFRLSGTPATLGNFPFTVRVTDRASPPQTAEKQYTISVNDNVTILNQNLAYAIESRAYDQQVAVVNGKAPLTWSADFLPQGLTIGASNGRITGVPAFATFVSARVKVTDSSTPPVSSEGFVRFTVYGKLRIQKTGFPIRVSAFSPSLYFVQGGVPSVSSSVAKGNLPPGTTVTSFGTQGSPTTTGQFNFVVRASDAAVPPQTAEEFISIDVLPGILRAATQDDTSRATVGQPYRVQFNALGGTAPFTWTAEGLPLGLSVDANGVISGTPAEAGAYQAGVRLTDSGSPAQLDQFNFTIQVKPASKARNETVATATPLGQGFFSALSISPYADPVDADPANPDQDYYRFMAPAGSTVTVTAEQFGVVDPVLEIVDANGIRFQTCKDPGDDEPPSFIVKDSTPQAFDDACLNDDISLGATLGSQLQFQAPGVAGSNTVFYAHVIDQRGSARPDMRYFLQAFGNIVPVLQIFTNEVNNVVVGKAFSAQLSAGGGTGNVTYSVASGTLPAGLSLSTAGAITGTADATGVSSVTFRATDQGTPPQTADKAFRLNVVQPIQITTTSLPDAVAGEPYSQQIQVTGGSPPYFWSSFSSNFPCCLNFNYGLLSGIAETPGNYSLNVSAGSGGIGDSKSLSLAVAPGALRISTQQLPSGFAGFAYSVTPRAFGGKAPYTWALDSGTLPTGVSLDASTGEIRGVPGSAGTYDFTMRVTDGSAPAQSVAKAFQLMIQ